MQLFYLSDGFCLFIPFPLWSLSSFQWLSPVRLKSIFSGMFPLLLALETRKRNASLFSRTYRKTPLLVALFFCLLETFHLLLSLARTLACSPYLVCPFSLNPWFFSALKYSFITPSHTCFACVQRNIQHSPSKCCCSRLNAYNCWKQVVLCCTNSSAQTLPRSFWQAYIWKMYWANTGFYQICCVRYRFTIFKPVYYRRFSSVGSSVRLKLSGLI